MRIRQALVRTLVLALMASTLAMAAGTDPARAATTLVVDQAADEAPDPGNQCTAALADCSLRQAVDAAVDGDTIEIAAGIDPVLSLGQITSGKDLTIQGQGALATTIDADHTSRVFGLTADADTVIRDLTLSEGQAPPAGHGGAIDSVGPLRIERVEVRDSRAGSGQDASPQFPLPSRGGSGGGVAARGGDLTVVDSTFTDNRAGEGGDSAGGMVLGIPIYGGDGGNGGALAFNAGSASTRFSVSGSTFVDNRAGDAGTHPDPDLGGVGGSGGAISDYWGSSSNHIVRSTFVGNRAGVNPTVAAYFGHGGAVSAEYVDLLVSSSTIVRNGLRDGASGTSGAIFTRNDTVTVEGSLLVDNAEAAGDLGTCDDRFGPIVGGADNIVFPADPSCPASATVADPWPDGDAPAPAMLGGPTATVALPAGSVAVDHIAAPDGACAIGATTDQRGIARPSGAGCDAGAFELVLDDTPPVITPLLESDAAPSNGWYSGDVQLTWTVVDDESPATSTGCDPVTVTTDGISTWTCSATSAGGSASETVTIQRDTVRPVVECGNTPTFVVGQSPALVTATASDALSGLQGEPVLQRDVSTTTAGQHDARFSVIDLARNGRAVLCDYVVVQNATALDAHPVLLKLTGRVSVNFPLGAKLTSSGLPLAGQPVSFSIAGRQRCTAVTNTSGFATCGTVLDWLTALLSGGFTATYAGTPVYSGSTDSAGLIG